MSIVTIETMNPTLNPRKNRRGQTIDWQDFEYIKQEDKSQDWFWVVGAITAGGILLAIILKNFLLALILLIGMGTAMALVNRKPELVTFSISTQGIKIKNNLYPLKEIDSFAIKDDKKPYKLMIESGRMIFPHIVIPLSHVDPEEVRDFLADFIPEVDFEESLVDKLSEQLGF